jgi:hypothetical protein
MRQYLPHNFTTDRPPSTLPVWGSQSFRTSSSSKHMWRFYCIVPSVDLVWIPVLNHLLCHLGNFSSFFDYRRRKIILILLSTQGCLEAQMTDRFRGFIEIWHCSCVIHLGWQDDLVVKETAGWPILGSIQHVWIWKIALLLCLSFLGKGYC